MNHQTVTTRRKQGKLPPHIHWPNERCMWYEADIDLFIECSYSLKEFNRRK